jgi:tyramine---L-glutamate ligase
MRLFLYEYTNAAPGEAGGAAALRGEGWAMLSALAADFGRVPGAHITTLLHHGVRQRLGHNCVHMGAGEERDSFRRLARAADFCLVIAPEFDDLLAARGAWVQEAGGRLLGATVDAIRLTADKLALAQHLHRHGVPTPATVPLEGSLASVSFPAVCKPRHGAGSRATFLVNKVSELAGVVAVAEAEMPGADRIVQPFMPGLSASVSFLLGPGRMVPLAPAAQELSADGRFHFRGGRLPLEGGLAERAVHLGRRAIESVSGLRGYAGVDLVLGEKTDGSLDYIIEINPRLTTSYIGLRRLARGNLADALLEVFAGREVWLEWNAGPVCFTVP